MSACEVSLYVIVSVVLERCRMSACDALRMFAFGLLFGRRRLNCVWMLEFGFVSCDRALLKLFVGWKRVLIRFVWLGLDLALIEIRDGYSILLV